ncbi:MAG: hypothetical protein JNL57_00505 [Bacteroidetes bacterium]|nr:hypothetical protein [Bacteroidota bacterium]
MNYFSHYYFDHIHSLANHNFGLALPDFVRNFARGHRLKPGLQPLPGMEDSAELVAGAEKHFSRDQVFHNSAFFHNTEQHIIGHLRPVFQSLGIPRYWFAAHVLGEMMLDRVLMKQHPAMLDAFYLDLSLASRPTIHNLLTAHSVNSTSDFFTRLDRFCEIQYLRRYVEDDTMVYSLNRIFMYTGADTEWDSSKYPAIMQTLPEIEHHIQSTLSSLQEEMV